MIISVTQETIDEAVALKRALSALSEGSNYCAECLLALAIRKATNLPVSVALSTVSLDASIDGITRGPVVVLPDEAFDLRRDFDHLSFDVTSPVNIKPCELDIPLEPLIAYAIEHRISL